MIWREMTDTEFEILPEARLGGALLWMVSLASVIVLIPLIGFIFTFLAPKSALGEIVTGLADLAPRYVVSVSFLVVWSATFVVMTLVRFPSTPAAASSGLVMWVVYRFLVSYFGQTLIDAKAGHGPVGELLAHDWPFATDMLAELVMVAAFCGYMAGGLRPNAYYRRRLPDL